MSISDYLYVDFLLYQTLVKTFEVCDLPVRASKFVARKNWVITGAVSRILNVFLRITVLEVLHCVNRLIDL